jgi:hypothetical protein
MKTMYIYLLLLVLFGCNSTKKVKSFADFKSQIMDEAYKNASVDNYRIENSDYLYIYHPYGIYNNGFCAVFSTISYSKKEFDIEEEKIKTTYKYISTKKEICIKYIPEEGDYMKKEICNEKLLPNINNSLVVPKDLLSDNVSFYIKTESNGIFLKKEYAQFFKSKFNHYHGYSSGAIIDNKNLKILYWLIIK